jgi:hypothetical protein
MSHLMRSKFDADQHLKIDWHFRMYSGCCCCEIRSTHDQLIYCFAQSQDQIRLRQNYQYPTLKKYYYLSRFQSYLI